MRLIDADELKTAFPCGESVRTECVRATINHMPTIEPKKGKWERVAYGNGLYNYHCSYCHNIPRDNILSNFCPNCGADMREGEQDETN